MIIHEILGKWYEENKRDLPWRNTSDPYKIWLSEVILQQTRVDQGLEYYSRFVKAFPDIFSIAGSDPEIILKLWQGLGYYTRARNLHKTAKQIVAQYNGIFPDTYDGLLRLAGIGPYTAAAIASIAFNETVAALDGNVRRVLRRLFMVKGKSVSGRIMKKLQTLAVSIMDPLHPGRHNQAMMELGALVCLPRDPRCIQCPVSLACAAYQSGCVNEIPGRIIRSKIKKRFLIFLIINLSHHNILIGRREGKDIWNHLYEFPVIESSSSPDIKDIPELVSGRYHIQPDEVIITRISTEIKHKLSHQHLVCRFIHMKTQNLHLLKGTKYSWIKISDFPALPIPRLIDRYITINGFF